MKFATKPIWHRPYHLRHVATVPCEIKNSNFCRYSADMEENASILHSPLTLLFVHKFWHFRCLKWDVFPHTHCKIIFCVTVLLLIYFCDQFVTSTIRHSRCHCSVCQRSTWYSATKTGFWYEVFIWRDTQQRGWQTNFLRNAGQSVALISCLKSYGTEALYRRPEIWIFNFLR